MDLVQCVPYHSQYISSSRLSLFVDASFTLLKIEKYTKILERVTFT